MISAFVNRRPWVAAVVALFFSPTIGMLYLGKGRLSLAYFALSLLLLSLLPVAAHFGLLPVGVDAGVTLVSLLIAIVGAVHCHRIAAASGQFRPVAWFARWYALLALVVLPSVLGFAIRTFAWEPFSIPSSSMEPGLRVGDYFFVSKLPYLLGEPERGDIAVVRFPGRSSSPYLKRLIGLPGDRIQLKGGSLYLNGELVPRERVDVMPEGNDPGMGRVYRETLPGGRSYLVRELSDRAQYDDTDVYEVPPGQYFLLGDNRDNSLDSRADLGFVPHENFIGRVSVILWNGKTQKLRFDFPE